MDQEQQIEDNIETKGSDEEIRRLKRMVLTFKRKYQRALQDISKQEESLPHDAADIVKKCQELEEECNSLIKQQQTLKQIIQKNKQEITSIKEENAALQEQQEILKNFLKEKETEKPLETEPQVIHEIDHQLIDSLQLQLSEREGNLRMAQQHLAKKMKEIVELREIISRQEESLEHFKEQSNQENSESIAKEKDLRDEIRQWENKYHELHQQWKNAVDSIEGLKKLEEKHLKMQDYIKNLGNIIEGTPPAPKKTNSKASDDELDLFNTDKYKYKDTN